MDLFILAIALEYLFFFLWLSDQKPAPPRHYIYWNGRILSSLN